MDFVDADRCKGEASTWRGEAIRFIFLNVHAPKWGKGPLESELKSPPTKTQKRPCSGHSAHPVYIPKREGPAITSILNVERPFVGGRMRTRQGGEGAGVAWEGQV